MKITIQFWINTIGAPKVTTIIMASAAIWAWWNFGMPCFGSHSFSVYVLCAQPWLLDNADVEWLCNKRGTGNQNNNSSTTKIIRVLLSVETIIMHGVEVVKQLEELKRPLNQITTNMRLLPQVTANLYRNRTNMKNRLWANLEKPIVSHKLMLHKVTLIMLSSLW